MTSLKYINEGNCRKRSQWKNSIFLIEFNFDTFYYRKQVHTVKTIIMFGVKNKNILCNVSIN